MRDPNDIEMAEHVYRTADADADTVAGTSEHRPGYLAQKAEMEALDAPRPWPMDDTDRAYCDRIAGRPWPTLYEAWIAGGYLNHGRVRVLKDYGESVLIETAAGMVVEYPTFRLERVDTGERADAPVVTQRAEEKVA